METHIAIRIDELINSDLSFNTFGFNCDHAEEGRVIISATPSLNIRNGHGIVHGGYIFSLADTAFAFAINVLCPGTVTMNASIEYLAPGKAHDVLMADARVIHQAGRTVLADVRVTSENQTLALYRGTGRIMNSSSNPKDVS